MARPKKQTVDYYPHASKQGKTMFILKSKYGNEGYAFFHQLCEVLCHTEGHVLDYGNQTDREYLLAYCGVEEAAATDMLNTLSDLSKIDAGLWSEKVIWYQNLVDSVSDAYKKRVDQIPKKPLLPVDNSKKPAQGEKIHTEMPVHGAGVPRKACEISRIFGVSTDGNTLTSEFPLRKTSSDGVSGSGSTETKLKETKLKETKEKNRGAKTQTVDNSPNGDSEKPSCFDSFSLYFKTFKKQTYYDESLKAYELAIKKGVSHADLFLAAQKYRNKVDKDETPVQFTKRADSFIIDKIFLGFLPKHDPNCSKCHGEGWVETAAGMAKCDCKNPYEEIKF